MSGLYASDLPSSPSPFTGGGIGSRGAGGGGVGTDGAAGVEGVLGVGGAGYMGVYPWRSVRQIGIARRSRRGWGEAGAPGSRREVAVIPKHMS